MAKARLRRGVEMVKLANRIELLKTQEDDKDDSDFPVDAVSAADQAKGHHTEGGDKRNLSRTIKTAIFREVVLAKVREMKQQQDTLKVKEEAEKEHRRRSFQG